MVKRSAAGARRLASRGLRAVGAQPTLIQRSRAVSAEAKAVFNQEGRVPREFFALSAADEAAIEATVEAYFDKALEE